MKRKTLSLLLSLLLILSLVSAACGRAEPAPQQQQGQQVETKKEPIVLKFAITQATSDPMAVHTQEMIKKVEEKTNGGIKFEFYPNGELGNLKDVMEQIVRGANIVMSQGADYMGDLVPDHGAMNAQYIYTEWTDIEKLTNSAWYVDIQKQVSAKGVKILAMNWFAGYRHIMSNKVIKTPADVKGMKIRVPNNIVFMEFVKSLNAAPIPTNWNEVYTSLAQKVVDGCEAPLATMYASKLFEVAKHISLTKHNITCTGIIMNQKIFDSLPAEYQKTLLDVAQEQGQLFAEENEKAEQEWIKKFTDEGVTFTDPDLAAFQQSVKAMYSKVPNWSPNLYDTIQKAIGR